MAEKFAFETDKVSIAYPLIAGLGDTVIAKKVLDAIIEVEPNCAVDIFYKEPQHREKYTLTVWVVGTFSVVFDGANIEQLKMSPALLNAALQVQQYNNQNVNKFKEPDFVMPIRNRCLSRILNRNFFYFLSCGGALPIRDEHVEIKLSPVYKRNFDKLKLGRYITIYSNIHRDAIRPKTKSWPIQYLREYVALMKNKFPRLSTVQVGGGGGYSNRERRPSLPRL